MSATLHPQLPGAPVEHPDRARELDGSRVRTVDRPIFVHVAGDTELDNFLSGVGLALLVGNQELTFRGMVDTIKLRDSLELGAVLFKAAELAAVNKAHG